MKPFYYYMRLFKKSKGRSNFRKRSILLGTLGVFTFLMISFLVLWAGNLTLSYVPDWTQQAVSNAFSNEYIKSLKEHGETLKKHGETLKDNLNVPSQLETEGCLERAQSLFAVGPWLERSLLANLRDLKDACLVEPPGGPD